MMVAQPGFHQPLADSLIYEGRSGGIEKVDRQGRKEQPKRGWRVTPRGPPGSSGTTKTAPTLPGPHSKAACQTQTSSLRIDTGPGQTPQGRWPDTEPDQALISFLSIFMNSACVPIQTVSRLFTDADVSICLNFVFRSVVSI